MASRFAKTGRYSSFWGVCSWQDFEAAAAQFSFAAHAYFAPCPSLCGQTPRGATQQVGHDVWTFKEGVPENIISIAQTTDGVLSVASPTGLFRA